MSQQISLRLSPKLLNDARSHAKKRGYRTVQHLIEESVRKEIYEELTPKEMELTGRFLRAMEDGKIPFGTSDDLREAFRKKSGKQR